MSIVNEQQNDQITEERETPDGSTPPPSVPQNQHPVEQRQPKILTIPSNAMSKIKKDERERGKKLALDEANAKARQLGFKDAADLESHALRAKNGARLAARPAARTREAAPPEEEEQEEGASKPQARAGQQNPHPRLTSRYEKQIAKLTEERKRLNRQVSHEEKKRKAIERELQAKDAESALRMEAIRNGVKDVDYAIELLRRSMSGKTAEELRQFDEGKFFREELRGTHPYLYGVDVVPADTSNAAAGGSPTAQRREGASGTPQNGAIDARSMSREDYNKLLRERGLLDPGNSSSMV